MNERVRRPLKHEDFLQALGGQSSNSEKPFDSLKSVLIFAAAVAIAKDLDPVPFERSGEKIPVAYFSGDYEKSFISSIALVKSGDISIIHPSRIQDQLDIFENFANAGIEWLYNASQHEVDVSTLLLSIISEANRPLNIIEEIFS